MRLGALEFSFYPTQTALENYPLPHRINSLWVIVLIQFGSVLTVEESDPLTIHLGVPRLKVNGTFFFELYQSRILLTQALGPSKISVAVCHSSGLPW